MKPAPARALLLGLCVSLCTAELQLVGLAPATGSSGGGETIIVTLAGVAAADWAGFDSHFFLTWPTGERTGNFQILGGRPDSPPASGDLNLTCVTRPKPADWNGPFVMTVKSQQWIDGWVVNRYASCPNATSCTFVYSAA